MDYDLLNGQTTEEWFNEDQDLENQKTLTLEAAKKYLDKNVLGYQSHVYRGIICKVIPFTEWSVLEDNILVDKLAQLVYRMPKILNNDPAILELIKKKNLNIIKHDILAFYRDYEKNVDPYYYYRAVV